MTAGRFLGAATRMADTSFFALLLSASYPAVFLLSLNWYAFTTEKIVFVIAVSVLAAVTAYALIKGAVWALLAAFPASRHPDRSERDSKLTLLLTAIACSVIFFFSMYGTLKALLGSFSFLLLCFFALTGFTVWLALNSRMRYWTGLLCVMTLLSLATWGQSIASAFAELAAEERQLIHSPIRGVKLKSTPNIYLVVYDGYGNSRLHRELFDVDNAAIYRDLAGRGFRVLDSYSNYWGTWESMLSVFLAEHHYYDVMTGVYDSKIGRWIMNGTAFSPVLSVLKENGYRVQYIEATDYLVKNRGNLDYVYPDVSEPAYTGLRVYDNPVLNQLPSMKTVEQKPNTLEGYVSVMADRLFSRLQQTAKDVAPWFTYVHFPLPAHYGGSYRDTETHRKDFYVTGTREANAHMLPTIDRILAMDPDAVIILMGDHGSFFYGGAAEGAADPNDVFKLNELDSNLITADYFGILLAIRSRGQCDSFIYPTMTPVNLMRVVFSCLSGNRSLLDSRPADISIFPQGISRLVLVPSSIWMTVRDGQILKPWIKIDRSSAG